MTDVWRRTIVPKNLLYVVVPWDCGERENQSCELIVRAYTHVLVDGWILDFQICAGELNGESRMTTRLPDRIMELLIEIENLLCPGWVECWNTQQKPEASSILSQLGWT